MTALRKFLRILVLLRSPHSADRNDRRILPRQSLLALVTSEIRRNDSTYLRFNENEMKRNHHPRVARPGRAQSHQTCLQQGRSLSLSLSSVSSCLSPFRPPYLSLSLATGWYFHFAVDSPVSRSRPFMAIKLNSTSVKASCIRHDAQYRYTRRAGPLFVIDRLNARSVP